MKNTSNDTVINSRNIHFFRQRQKNKVFQSVVAYFEKQAALTGLTKKELAKRLQKEPSSITRWFSGPGNWTLDTISDLLLAMDAEMNHSIMSLSTAVQDFAKVDAVLDRKNKTLLLPTSESATTTETYRQFTVHPRHDSAKHDA